MMPPDSDKLHHGVHGDKGSVLVAKSKRPRLLSSLCQDDSDTDEAKTPAAEVNPHGSSSLSSSPTPTTSSTTTFTLQRILGRFFPLGHAENTEILPASLRTTKAGNDLEALRSLLDRHGFRTSILSSPRRGLSIYMDSFSSCCLRTENESAAVEDDFVIVYGSEFLAAMFGLHPLQHEIERSYAEYIRHLFCLRLFCQRIRKACAAAVEDSQPLSRALQEAEGWCRTQWDQISVKAFFNVQTTTTTSTDTFVDPTQPSASADRLAQIQQLAVKADLHLRSSQLEHEYRRIQLQNSTLANAYLSIFVDYHGLIIKEVYFKHSSPSQPQFDRFTVYLYDSALDDRKPVPTFSWMPCLPLALQSPSIEGLAQLMLCQFWQELRLRGYLVTAALQSAVGPSLQSYLKSGLARNPSSPLFLNAHFTPAYSLSFYLHGPAGAGKSSLVRHFGPALNSAIARYADPELLVRHVKQNLNKPEATLRLELDLRPNNNDRSVMSIVQSRRCTMGQSKPGLVVVALEEMPSCTEESDPNQRATAQLIRQRFAGRKGDYKTTATASKDAARSTRSDCSRGIGSDATIVPLFTSNYELEESCRETLQTLPMFQNLQCISMTAVSGSDRLEFAHKYLTQRLREHEVVAPNSDFEIQWRKTTTTSMFSTVPEGDTRPLVQLLRMLSFYISNMLKDKAQTADIVNEDDPTVTVVLHEMECGCKIQIPGGAHTELRLGGSMGKHHLFPVPPRIFDLRVASAIASLRAELGDHQSSLNVDELSLILDFWLAGTLAPAVIVSSDKRTVERLVAATSQLGDDVYCLPSVSVSHYKMMRSLYDPSGTPNLRDDIIATIRGRGKKQVFIELHCETTNEQLAIREIIEDTPSMTAFSSEKSALHKEGLLFGVYVQGEITPEVRSRASLVLNL